MVPSVCSRLTGAPTAACVAWVRPQSIAPGPDRLPHQQAWPSSSPPALLDNALPSRLPQRRRSARSPRRYSAAGRMNSLRFCLSARYSAARTDLARRLRLPGIFVAAWSAPRCRSARPSVISGHAPRRPDRETDRLPTRGLPVTARCVADNPCPQLCVHCSAAMRNK